MIKKVEFKYNWLKPGIRVDIWDFQGNLIRTDAKVVSLPCIENGVSVVNIEFIKYKKPFSQTIMCHFLVPSLAPQFEVTSL